MALYDYEWSDHRDVKNISPKSPPEDWEHLTNPWEKLYKSAPWWEDYSIYEEFQDADDMWRASFEAEVFRPIKPATFQQHLELKEEGSYELKACMSGYFQVDDINSDVYSGGGIVVQLLQWHKDTVRFPTRHARVPDVDNFDQLTFDNLNYLDDVDAFTALPLAKKHDAVYVLDEEEYYTYNGQSWQVLKSGGHIGHAGLGTEYPELHPQTEGVWTCHTQVVGLAPGFYLLQGAALPFTTNDDYDYDDYDGWGSIRTIMLRKVDAIGAN